MVMRFYDILYQQIWSYSPPELIGRFPIIANMNSLDEETLYRILIEPKNALIKQYQKLFAVDYVYLKVTDKAIRKIVEKTLFTG